VDGGVPKAKLEEFKRVLTKRPRMHFMNWVQAMAADGMTLGLVTNSHFCVPEPGCPTLKALAAEMATMLERYASMVKRYGVSHVQRVQKNGRSRSPLPNGNIGMAIFQRAVAGLLSRSGKAGHPRPRVLHWSVFNPVDATDPQRMLNVLNGDEDLGSPMSKAIHIFREVRDAWGRRNCALPTKLTVSEVAPARSAHRKRRRAASAVEGQRQLDGFIASQSPSRP